MSTATPTHKVAYPQPLAATDVLEHLQSLADGNGWANNDCPFSHYVDEITSGIESLELDDLDDCYVIIDRLSGVIYDVACDWDYPQNEMSEARTMMYALPVRVVLATVNGEELPQDYLPMLKCLNEYREIADCWEQSVDYGDDDTTDRACDLLARNGGWSDDLLELVVKNSHASLPNDVKGGHETCADTANVKYVRENYPELYSVMPHSYFSNVFGAIDPEDRYLVAWQAAQVLDALEYEIAIDDCMYADEQQEHIDQYGEGMISDIVDDVWHLVCTHDVPTLEGELDILEDSTTIAYDFMQWLNDKDGHATHTLTADTDDIISLVSTVDYEPLKDYEAYRLILAHASEVSAKTIDAITQAVVKVR